MLFIDKDEPTVIQAREIHIKKVSCRIRRKVNSITCSDKTCEICRNTCKEIEHLPKKMKDILTDDQFLPMILGGLPEDLYLMCEMVWEELIPGFDWDEYHNFLKIRSPKKKNKTVDQLMMIKKYNETYNFLYKIFDYDEWFKNGNDVKRYDAYQLATNLNRYTCTYCNRLYTSTMKTHSNKKIMRPTFDHWFSHGRHPLLALSFYNLIPSCTICNSSVKGSEQYTIASHLHPYLDKDCADEVTFDYDFDKTTSKFDIKLVSKPNTPRALKSYSDWKLKEMYNAHHSEVADLIRIKEAYSDQYVANVLKNYPKAGLSPEEIYRLAFGVEFETVNYHKRPLSKFTKDILTKLKMV